MNWQDIIDAAVKIRETGDAIGLIVGVIVIPIIATWVFIEWRKGEL